MATIEDLVGRVLATRDGSHLAHWATKTYASHVALNEFYDAVLDQIDSIVEKYQGTFGLIGNVKTATVPSTDVAAFLGHLEAEMNWIANERDKLSKGSQALANQIDEIVAVYAQAIYKLRFLK
jgi:Family of unknown function (DUF5856)